MSAEDLTNEDNNKIKEGNEKCKNWLNENGWEEENFPEIPKFKEKEGEAFVQAFPIMGIEKYLGNADKNERIAYFPQIKMCHDSSVTKTYVKFSNDFEEDIVIICGKITDIDSVKGMRVLVNKLREWTGLKTNFLFISDNFEKIKANAKGIGTSASAAGACAKAFTEAIMPELSKNSRFLSYFARYFSGSGTSSAAGGWSIWLSYKGIDPKESYGVRFDKVKTNLKVVMVPIPSTIKTENAHGAAEKSELYRYWALNKPEKCIRLMEAVKNDDITTIGQIAELDSLNLFHLLVSGNSFFNWEPDTLDLLRKVNLLRKDGLTAFASMDTGPSVAIITTKNEAEEVKTKIEKHIKDMGKDYPLYFSDIAGPPEVLPLKQKEEIITDNVKKILEEKSIKI